MKQTCHQSIWPRNMRMIALSTLIAGIVVGLQIGLPAISFFVSNRYAKLAPVPHDKIDWKKHFCFERLFYPDGVPSMYANEDFSIHFEFTSATIHGDELFVLLRVTSHNNWTGERTSEVEVVRLNTKNGALNTSKAQPGINYVLSDGKTLWWLPELESMTEVSEEFVTAPLLLDGRPVAIKRSLPNSYYMHKFVEFVNGQWRSTDHFLLAPRFAFERLSTFNGSLTSDFDGDVRLLYYSSEEIFYSQKLNIGSEKEAIIYGSLHGKPIDETTESELNQANWHHFRFDYNGIEHPFNPLCQADEFGFLIKGGYPFVLATQTDDHGFEPRKIDFLRCSFLPDGPTGLVRQPTPISYFRDPYFKSNEPGWFRVVTSAEGRVFIVSFDGRDERLHFLVWDDDGMRLIGTRGSIASLEIGLELVLLALIGVAIPTLLFGLLIAIFERRGIRRSYSYGTSTTILANSTQRGIAKLVDLSIPVVLFFSSIALHPDFVGWWRHLLSVTQWLYYLNDLDLQPRSITEFCQRISLVFQAFVPFAAIPIRGDFFVTSIAIMIAQVYWQGRSGYTIGKFLTGIKLVRTHGRPCGIARSLLREVFLVFDSVALLCWVPGVILILVTPNSQRLGDLLADTVVIRDKVPSTTVSARQEHC